MICFNNVKQAWTLHWHDGVTDTHSRRSRKHENGDNSPVVLIRAAFNASSDEVHRFEEEIRAINESQPWTIENFSGIFNWQLSGKIHRNSWLINPVDSSSIHRETFSVLIEFASEAVAATRKLFVLTGREF